MSEITYPPPSTSNTVQSSETHNKQVDTPTVVPPDTSVKSSNPSTNNVTKEQSTSLEKSITHQTSSPSTESTKTLDPSHPFWGTQPVPLNPKQMPSSFQQTSAIESKEAKISILRKTPYDLPPDLEWFDLDINDKQQMQEVHDLLANNYVEDSDAWFRFDYSTESILWAITLPGTYPEWRFGIRTTESKVMVGLLTIFIQAMVFHPLMIKSSNVLLLISSVCIKSSVHVDLLPSSSKRLPEELTSAESSRLSIQVCFLTIQLSFHWYLMLNIYIVFVSVFPHIHLTYHSFHLLHKPVFSLLFNLSCSFVCAAGRKLPTPFTVATYYHRALNVEKLVDVRFTYIQSHMTMERTKKLYRLNDVTIPGWRYVRYISHHQEYMYIYTSDSILVLIFTVYICECCLYYIFSLLFLFLNSLDQWSRRMCLR